mgnify:CR=1 FL=1
MTEALSRREQVTIVQGELTKWRSVLMKAAQAAESKYSLQRLEASTLLCLARDDKLRQAAASNPDSLIQALTKCVTTNLYPENGACWLIPRKNSVTYQDGYRGYVELANQANVTLWAEVVRLLDEFEDVTAPEPTLTHKRWRPRTTRTSSTVT